MVKYSRFNRTIQIVVDHQTYLPTMSVIATNRMNPFSKTSAVYVGTPDMDRKSSEIQSQPASEEFVKYNGCISSK